MALREKDAIKMAKMLTEEHMTIRQIAEKTNYCKWDILLDKTFQ